MRSVIAGPNDLTARARIRDAAITRFAADGFAAASIRAIAAEAGVSPGLVIHHFGSKDALRRACDQYVAEVIRTQKQRTMQAGPAFDPIAAFRDADLDIPAARYLANALIDHTPHVAALVDELVADATEYLATGVEAGTLRPSDRPRTRAVLLTVWSLGALLLADHVERLLGADLTADPAALFATPEGADYVATGMELLSGLFTDEAAAALRSAFADTARPDTQEMS